jgi:hypothetical protein
MEPYTAFARAPGIIVLNPESAEDMDGAIVHPDRNAELKFTHGDP